MSHYIEMNHVGYSYHTITGETNALQDVSFQIEKGEFAAIVGPSGCGKSTILSLLANLMKPETGEINYDSKVTFGYMLQSDELLEYRNIEKNIMLGLEIQKKLTKENIDDILRKAEEYGLKQFLKSRPHELSGGMRQRAALLRTLAIKPTVLLLDEPFSALDYQTRLNVGDDIGKIIRNEGKTAILVTHDLSEAISLSDHIVILSKRPCRVVDEIYTEFSPQLSSLERRNEPLFKEYFNRVWGALNYES